MSKRMSLILWTNKCALQRLVQCSKSARDEGVVFGSDQPQGDEDVSGADYDDNNRGGGQKRVQSV